MKRTRWMAGGVSRYKPPWLGAQEISQDLVGEGDGLQRRSPEAVSG